MNAKFEFDLTRPDDKLDYEIYSQAGEMHCFLTDVRDKLKQERKYAENPMTVLEFETWFYELANERGIKFL